MGLRGEIGRWGAPTIARQSPSPLAGPLDLLRLVGLFGGALVVGIAIRTARRGRHAFFAYAGGLVHCPGDGMRIHRWGDVVSQADTARAVGSGHRVVGYSLWAADGARVSIPLAVRGGRDPFVDVVLAQLAAHGGEQPPAPAAGPVPPVVGQGGQDAPLGPGAAPGWSPEYNQPVAASAEYRRKRETLAIVRVVAAAAILGGGLLLVATSAHPSLYVAMAPITVGGLYLLWALGDWWRARS